MSRTPGPPRVHVGTRKVVISKAAWIAIGKLRKTRLVYDRRLNRLRFMPEPKNVISAVGSVGVMWRPDGYGWPLSKGYYNLNLEDGWFYLEEPKDGF